MTVTLYYLGVCVSGEGGVVLYLDCLNTKRTCYQPSYRAWCLDSQNGSVGGGDRRYPYKFRYRVEGLLKK